MDVSDADRKIDLRLTSMENRQVVPAHRQHPHDVRADEARPTEDKYTHVFKYRVTRPERRRERR